MSHDAKTIVALRDARREFADRIEAAFRDAFEKKRLYQEFLENDEFKFDRGSKRRFKSNEQKSTYIKGKINALDRLYFECFGVSLKERYADKERDAKDDPSA